MQDVRVVAPTALDALVLDLDTRGGLSIVRALGDAGLRLATAAPVAAPGLRTRHADARFLLPAPADGVPAALAALVDALRRQPVDVILTSGDPWLALLHEHRATIAPLAAPAVGAPEAVALALSKPRTLALAAELGIPAPRSLSACSVAEAAAAADELGLPVVLKPASSWRPDDGGDGGDRLSPTWCATRAEVEAAAAALARPDAPVLVQEVAPGARETHKLFVAGGEVLARVVMEPQRCWPPLGGSSTMRQTIRPPADSAAMAERLVLEAGLDGYSEVEFRRSVDGRPLLMEINPRLSQSIEIARKAGVDFARMQLEWARGGRLDRVEGYRIGVRVGWLAGDARFAVSALRGSGSPAPARRDAAQIGRDYLTGTRIEGLDLSDPRPVLSALAFNARGLVKKLAA
jgi:predicted ATP-grasp superfamily ATP-dependent carboligase